MTFAEICKSFNRNKYLLCIVVLLAPIFLGTTACNLRDEAPATSSETRFIASAAAININTTSAGELQKIPYIGEKLAAQIVEHRERYGPFRTAESLILIPGISDSRFRKIRELVRVD